MRKKLTASLACLSLLLVGVSYFKAEAQTPGPEHCAVFCEPSVIYNCIVSNPSTGQSHTCTWQQVKGTTPPEQ